jgi:uncharacterized protein YrzB (UPF0473 family)
MYSLGNLEKIEIQDLDGIVKEFAVLFCYDSKRTGNGYVFCIDENHDFEKDVKLIPFIMEELNNQIVYNLVEKDEDKQEVEKIIDEIINKSSNDNNELGEV